MTVEISKGDLFHKGFESSNKSPSSKHIKTKPDSSDRKHYPEVTVIFSGGGMTVLCQRTKVRGKTKPKDE